MKNKQVSRANRAMDDGRREPSQVQRICRRDENMGSERFSTSMQFINESSHQNEKHRHDV